ncbi:Gfo/Idh/MocA family protein [Streptomyces sp. NPDC020983]|uniref:Gfo/Idh/MocA family protein n=1 Tax=Streptomyces sp. NPDC020983 TaxID=3365106 RepID=UPI0037A02C8B
MTKDSPRFALVGAAGFVVRRHLDAMRHIGGTLVAAHDICDSVGILDNYFPQAKFFLDTGRFEQFVRDPASRVDYLVICTPSDTHERYCVMGAEAGVDVIVEKPPVLALDGIGRLGDLERRTGRRIHPILQLRYHEALVAFKKRMDEREADVPLRIEARYVARRGPWYQVSWKGDQARSGTILFNFGIHLFDCLVWIFGPPTDLAEVSSSGEGDRACGVIRFGAVEVDWLLSSRAEDLPAGSAGPAARTITVNGRTAADFSDNYAGLHTTVYSEIAAGRGHRIGEAYEVTALIERLRELAAAPPVLSPSAR